MKDIARKQRPHPGDPESFESQRFIAGLPAPSGVPLLAPFFYRCLGEGPPIRAVDLRHELLRSGISPEHAGHWGGTDPLPQAVLAVLRANALRFAAQCTGGFESLTHTGVSEEICCPRCNSRRSKAYVMDTFGCVLGPRTVKSRLERALARGRAAAGDFCAERDKFDSKGQSNGSVPVARVKQGLQGAFTELLDVKEEALQSARDEWGLTDRLLTQHGMQPHRDRAIAGQGVTMKVCARSVFDPDVSVGVLCPTCGKKGNGSKQPRIWMLPDVARFQISRFEFPSDRKILTPVRLDTALDLGPMTLPGCVAGPHVPAPLTSTKLVIEALAGDAPDAG